MELKKIDYFLRIVDEGSLSKAASSLYLTQPTLSRFLANLEEEVGIKLFERGKDNSLKMTAAGQLYLEAARKIAAVTGDLETQLSRYRTAVKNKILLGVDADGLLSFSGDCAEAVNRKFPHIVVEILRKNSFEIQRLVQKGELDLGLTAYGQPDRELCYIPVRSCPVDMVVGLDNPLAKLSYQLPGQEELTFNIKDLPANTPMALLRDGTVFRNLVDRILAQMKAHPYVVRTYVRQCTGIEMVAASSALVTFCPRESVSEQVACIALKPEWYYTKGICYARSMRITPAQKYLMQLLREIPDGLDIYS